MEHESTWVYAIEENELKENSANMVFPKGLPVLLIKKAGEIYAISNKCAHMACTLAGGTLKDYIIECPCPVPADFGEEPMPESLMKFFQYAGMLLSKLRLMI